MTFHYSQIADITAKLQKESDEFTAANEVLLLKVEKLYAENGDIGLENATLKVGQLNTNIDLLSCVCTNQKLLIYFTLSHGLAPNDLNYHIYKHIL